MSSLIIKISQIFRSMTNNSPPYLVTIFITFIGAAGNFALERYMDARKAYSTEVSDLKSASGEFIALGGEFALPIIKKNEPDSDIRTELNKNILKQITIIASLQSSSSEELKNLLKEYSAELEKTKILVDRTNKFDQLQALYQRYNNTRASWKRLNRVL